MSADLDLQSKVLLDRLRKQQSLPAGTAATHELGGVARVSAELEKLLRLAIQDIAIDKGTTADALALDAAGWRMSIRRATGRDLLKVLAGLSRDPSAGRAGVRQLVREAARTGNRIDQLLLLRNDLIHGGPDPAVARKAVQAVEAFVVAYRRDAGWEK